MSYLQTVIYPRPSPLTEGWMGLEPAIEVAGNRPPAEQLTHSYRMPAVVRLPRDYEPTFAHEGWMPSVAMADVPSWAPVWAQPHSFRMGSPVGQIVMEEIIPLPDAWINSVVEVEVTHRVPVWAQSQSFRTPARFRQLIPQQDVPPAPDAWMSEIVLFPPLMAPVIHDPGPRPYAGVRPWPILTDMEVAWITETLVVISDEIKAGVAQRGLGELSRWWLHPTPRPTMPEFSPFAIRVPPLGVAAFLSVAPLSYRMPPRRQFDNRQELTRVDLALEALFNPMLVVASQQWPFWSMTAKRPSAPRVAESEVAWITETLVAITTAQILPAVQSMREVPVSFLRRNRQLPPTAERGAAGMTIPPIGLGAVLSFLNQAFRTPARRILNVPLHTSGVDLTAALREIFSPAFMAAISQQAGSYRLPTVHRRPIVPDPELAWITENIPLLTVAQRAAFTVISVLPPYVTPRWPAIYERVTQATPPLILVPSDQGPDYQLLHSFRVQGRKVVLAAMQVSNPEAIFVAPLLIRIASEMQPALEQLRTSEYRLRDRPRMGSSHQAWEQDLGWIIAPEEVLRQIQWLSTEALRQSYRLPDARLTAWLRQVESAAQEGWLSELAAIPSLFDPQYLSHVMGERTHSRRPERFSWHEWLNALPWLAAYPTMFRAILRTTPEILHMNGRDFAVLHIDDRTYLILPMES